eukprot:Pgem_evm1s1185
MSRVIKTSSEQIEGAIYKKRYSISCEELPSLSHGLDLNYRERTSTNPLSFSYDFDQNGTTDNDDYEDIDVVEDDDDNFFNCNNIDSINSSSINTIHCDNIDNDSMSSSNKSKNIVNDSFSTEIEL